VLERAAEIALLVRLCTERELKIGFVGEIVGAPDCGEQERRQSQREKPCLHGSAL
jgi:hypothetical protein